MSFIRFDPGLYCGQPSAADFRNKRVNNSMPVLIVDDEKDTLRAMERFLGPL